MTRSMRAFFVAQIALIGLFFLGSLFAFAIPSAEAHLGREQLQLQAKVRPEAPGAGLHGRARVDTSAVVLRPGPTGFRATFTLTNIGEAPLEIDGVTFMRDDAFAREPAGFSLAFRERENQPIPVGGSEEVTIAWSTAASLATTAEGAVLITSRSAAPGATEWDPPIAVRFSADRRPWGAAPLAVALAPLLLLLVVAVGRWRPTFSDRLVMRAAAWLGLVIAIAAWVPVAMFVRVIGRADGGFGVQQWTRLGAHWLFGVDGVTVGLLPVPALLGFSLLVANPKPSRGAGPFVAQIAWVTTALSLVILSQEVYALVCGGGILLVQALLLSARGSIGGRAALAVAPLVISLGALFLLSAHLPTWAEHVDPSGTFENFAWSEIGRGALERRAHGAPIEPYLFGLLAVVAWIGAQAFPFGGWLTRRPDDRGRVALLERVWIQLTLAVVTSLVLLRVTPLLVTADARGALPILSAIGVALVLISAGLSALEPQLDRAISLASGALVGLALLGFASRTPEGFYGAVVLLIARPILLGLGLLVTSHLIAALGSGHGPTGLGGAMPRLATFWALTVTVLSTGLIVPLMFIGFAWLGRAPESAFALGLIVLALALAARRLLAVLPGRPPLSWSTSPRLEATGGLPSDWSRRELVWALALSLAVVALGLAPRPWIGGAMRASRDWILPTESTGPDGLR